MVRLNISQLLRTACAVGIACWAAGCTAPPPEDPVMPPRAPTETIQSTIMPEKPAPRATPAPPSVPEGILLLFEGKEVSFDDLPPVDIGQQTPTVTVQASPSTRYRVVEQVLEELHARGYLVTFTSQSTP